MLSNQILQRTIHEMSDILECNCSLWDAEGELLAAVGTQKPQIRKLVQLLLEEDSQELYRFTEEDAVYRVQEDGKTIYVFALEHHGKAEGKTCGRLCVSQWESMLSMNKVKMDKNRFMQNLLMDNLLSVDVLNQAKRLMIPLEQRRVVFLIEPKTREDEIVLELVRGIYTSGSGDYVTAVESGHVILIKSLETYETYDTVNEIANMLVNTMNTEAMINVRIACGMIVSDLQNLSQSYKEAGVALEVGRIFYPERSLLAYNELGVGRLIHKIPESLCERFLEEVFGEEDKEIFDEETLLTVDKFFENNLNISETARQLFVHRNTLMHRLEKIERYTGLDVRTFEDALTFKIALMVADQRKYTQQKNRK